MFVTMLGNSYYRNPLGASFLGASFLGAEPFFDSETGLWVDPATNRTSTSAPRNVTQTNTFWQTAQSFLNMGTGSLNAWLEKEKAKADADTAAALAKVQQAVLEGKSLDQARSQMSYTPFIVGGGVLVAGLVVTAIIMSSSKRRR